MTRASTDRSGGSVAAVAIALCLLSVGAVGAAGVAGAQTDGTLSLSAEGGAAAPNGTASLEITLENTGEDQSVGPVVRVVELPPGWTVVGQSSPEGVWRSSTREWLWTDVDSGGSVSATLELAVPANASGEYAVSLRGEDAADASASAEATVDVGPGAGQGSPLPGRGLVGGVAALLLAAGTGLYLYRRRRRGGDRRD